MKTNVQSNAHASHGFEYAEIPSPSDDLAGGVASADPPSAPISAGLEAELREHTRTLRILQRVATALVAPQDLSRVVQVVTDAGRELFGAAVGAYFQNMEDGDGEAYALYTLSGVPREAFSTLPMPRKTPLFAPTFEGTEVVRLDDVTHDPRYGSVGPHFGLPTGHYPIRSYLAAPVISKSGKVLGGLFFGDPEPGIFTQAEADLAVALAAQAAVAIDNAHLNAALQEELLAAREAERTNRWLAAIVASSDDAIVGKTLAGVITTWNIGAERLFGYRAEEVLGRAVTLLFPEGMEAEEEIIIGRIRRGERIEHYETKRRHKDGHLIDVSLTVSPILDDHGEIVGASKIARDITERKQEEEALRLATSALAAAKAELEMRVEERTASLREAIAQMEEFSYTVSHDLRAPLRAMNLHCGMLLEDFRPLLETEPDALRSVHRISENAKRLDKMIRDVLLYGAVARAEVHLEPVSLDRLVSDTIDNYPVLQAPHAEIEVATLGTVLGHEPSMMQILSNLLLNAVKFVAEGTRPKVRVWTEQTSAERLRLWVEDNGIGIDPRFQHRLFTMFERIHPNLRYEGTGVGLAIVRKAAERMGALVGVESDGVHGSRFWLEFPTVAA